jgi:hypothetical protein
MKPNIIPSLRVQHDWNLSFKDFTPIWISFEEKIFEELTFKDEILQNSKNFNISNLKVLISFVNSPRTMKLTLNTKNKKQNLNLQMSTSN